MKKRILSMILVVCMCLGMMPVTGAAVSESGNRYYIPESAPQDGKTGLTEIPTNPTEITSDSVSWNAADKEWYLVSAGARAVEIAERITVTGNVNLVLADGSELHAKQGITVGEDSSLTIWSQSADPETMGKLMADGKEAGAGIGGLAGTSGDGVPGNVAGTITINGGVITATGVGSAGIGGGAGGKGTDGTDSEADYGQDGGYGGNGGAGGTIVINGGVVKASSTHGAGIGGGAGGSGGQAGHGTTDGRGGIGGIGGSGAALMIHGGTVTAGSADGAGIGGGYGGKCAKGSQGLPGGAGGSGGRTRIYGGLVTATSTRSAGIGGGGSYNVTDTTGGTTVISGGTVTATGYNGIGIGGTISSSFKTQEGSEAGNAVIFTNGIADRSGSGRNWSGVIFENTEGQVYGKPVVSSDAVIRGSYTLKVPKSSKLTVASGTELTLNGNIVCSGIFENNGIISGTGKISGDGSFKTSGSSDGELFVVGVPPTMIYNGRDLSGNLNNPRLVQQLCHQNFSVDGWSYTIQRKQGEDHYITVNTVVAAGDYRILFTNAHSELTKEQGFRVIQSSTSIASVDSYLGDRQTDIFTYGEVITVKAKPQSNGTVMTAELPDDSGLSENHMALYFNGRRISDPVQADESGTFVMTYDTASKKIPAVAMESGKIQLVAKFKGDSNMSNTEVNVPVTIQKRELFAMVKDGYSAPFNGTNTFANVPLDHISNLVGNDHVIASAEGTVAGDSVGDGIPLPFTASNVILLGDYQGYYRLPAANVIGSIVITPKPVERIEIEVTAPVPGQAPEKYLSGTGYTGEVYWFNEDGAFDGQQFGYGSVYYANVLLTPAANYTFKSARIVSGLEGAKLQSGTIVGSVRFKATPQAVITQVTKPEDFRFAQEHDTLESAMTELPETMAIIAQDGTNSLKLSWMLSPENPGGKFNASLEKSNVFHWTADPGRLNPKEQPMSGSITVGNVKTRTPAHRGMDLAVSYDGSIIDLSRMFKLDSRTAGWVCTYTQEGGDGVGSISDHFLTVTKAGTFEIRLHTNAQGEFAAGDAAAILTVQPKKITITIGNQKIRYGQEIEDSMSLVTQPADELAAGHVMTDIHLITENKDVTSEGRITGTGLQITQDGHDRTGCYEVTYAGGNLIIEKIDPQVQAPEAKQSISGGNLVYNGTNQVLVNAGTTTGGQMMYRLDDDVLWTEEVPTAKMVGAHTVWYKVVGGRNYNDVGISYLEVTIDPLKVDLTARDQVVPYGAEVVSSPDKVDCALAPGDRFSKITLVSDTPQITKDGLVMPVDWKMTDGAADVTDCYTVTPHNGKLTVTLAEPVYDAPEGKKDLEFTNGLQDLIKPGSSKHGTILYRLSTEKEWSSTVPQGEEVGDYVVYYKLKPDEFHTEVRETRLPTITIGPKNLSNVTIVLDPPMFVYDGQAHKPRVTVKDGNTILDPSEYDVEYRSNTEASDDGAIAIVKEKNGGNYKLPASSKKFFTIAKADSQLDQIESSSSAITYGDTLVVRFTPQMLQQSKFLTRLFTSAPSEEVAELYWGKYKVSAIKGVKGSQTASFTVKTTDHTIPAEAFNGQPQTFTIKWGGDTNLKEATGSVSITLKPLPVTATLTAGQSRQYDGTDAFANATMELNNVQNHDDVYGVASGTLSGIDASDVPWQAQVENDSIQLEGKDAGYYSLSAADLHGTYRIDPRTVELKWEGLSQDYTGEPLQPSATVKNTVGDESVTVDVTVSGSHSDAGTYTAVVRNVRDSNYALPADNTILFTINRVQPAYAKPQPVHLTYNGGQQSLLDKNTRGSTEHGDLLYSDREKGTYGTTVPKGQDAGTYTVWYKLKGDRNHLDVEPKSVDVVIDPKNIEGGTVTLGPELVYTGENQEQTVVSVEIDGLDATFELEDETGKDARTYTLAAKGVGNFTGTIRQRFSISPASVTVVPDPEIGKIYGEKDPEFTYTVKLFGKDKLSGRLSRIAGETVGRYEYHLGTLHNDNYVLNLDNINQFEIRQKELTVEISIADKQYDGTRHAVISSAKLSGVIGDDEVLLTGGKATFTSEDVGKKIPVILEELVLSGADAENYVLVQPEGITGNIVNDFKPLKGQEYILSGEGWLNHDLVITAAQGYQLALKNTAETVWSKTLTGSEVGKDSSITFFVKNTETGAISNPVEVKYMLDKTPPTASASIGDLSAWQSFLNTITFDTLYKDSQKLKVTAQDELSGVKRIDLVLMARAMTQEEVEKLPADVWTKVSGDTVIKAEDAKKFVFYIRIMDEAGNVTYISTDGAEFDTQAPIIKGVSDGGTYYTTQKVTVTDKHLATVLLNDQTAPEEIILKPVNEKTVYKIEALDQVGNKTTAVVTMNPLAEAITPTDGLTEDNVTSEHKKLLEEKISQAEELLKNPFLSEEERTYLTALRTQWDRLLARVNQADAAMHTDAVLQAESLDLNKITLEQKPVVEQAWSDLNDALMTYSGNYTEAERKQLQTAIDRAALLRNSLAKAADVLLAVNKLPAAVEPDDEMNEAKILAAQAAFDALSKHEKEMVGSDVETILTKLQEDLVRYRITHGNGAVIGADNQNDMIMIANGNAKKFVGLFIDKKEVGTGNYMVNSGSTIVTVKNSFLKTLDDKEHSILFKYTDGEIEGSFTTAKGFGQNGSNPSGGNGTPGQNGTPGTDNGTGGGNGAYVPGGNGSGGSQNVPQTGDSFLPALCLIVLASAGAAVLVLLKKKKATR